MQVFGQILHVSTRSPDVQSPLWPLAIAVLKQLAYEAHGMRNKIGPGGLAKSYEALALKVLHQKPSVGE